MATDRTVSPPEGDINERVTEEWKAETDAFERVTQVAEQTREPATSADIADRAHVSKTTAIKHLKRLASFGVVEQTSDGNALRWRRNESHAALQRAMELRAETDSRELVEAVEEMQAEIETYRERYGVDSPEALARTLDSGDETGWNTLQRWQTTAKNLGIAKLALALADIEDVL